MMNNPVLKRRLNPFLLATTVLVLSLLAGLSVMYQGQLSDILSDKKSLEQNLEDKNQKLSDLRAENANLTQELEQKESRISSLSSESSSLESEVKTLEEEVEGLEYDNSVLEKEIDETEKTLEDMNESLGDICSMHRENISENTYTSGECEDWGHDLEE